ncbi:MAG: ZIP family metal transporter [Thaumarchaeota archaeon]|nr:ZIP family metal transporter [Nitrososphaerota archaeon]
MTSLPYALLLGLVAGLFPVYLGLVPLLFLRRISEGWRGFMVSLSLGILLFLFVDVTNEGLKLANVPSVNSFLFPFGLALGVFGPVFIARKRRSDYIALRERTPGEPDRRKLGFLTAYMMAMGIGLHNLGEGLAIGSAYSADKFVLTSVLVIGFALHNGTEGFGIAAPLSAVKMQLKDPLVLGLIAGFPTVIGSGIGFIAYSDLLGTFFFAVAAGALLYVIVELLRIANVYPKIETTFIGIICGMLLMFATSMLLVV